MKMKDNIIRKALVMAFVALVPMLAQAQDDDMYYVPKKGSKVEKSLKTYYSGTTRNIDEYNRRGQFRSKVEVLPADSALADVIDFQAGDGIYPDSIGVKSFAQEYYGPAGDWDDDADYRYSRELNRWYNSYDPWYWSWNSPWYSPYASWHYGAWYDPWYDPWYYGSAWYGRWYGGWYTGWGYNPWYWGYGHYGYYGWPYYHDYYYPHYNTGGGTNLAHGNRHGGWTNVSQSVAYKRHKDNGSAPASVASAHKNGAASTINRVNDGGIRTASRGAGTRRTVAGQSTSTGAKSSTSTKSTSTHSSRTYSTPTQSTSRSSFSSGNSYSGGSFSGGGGSFSGGGGSRSGGGGASHGGGRR